MKLELGEGILNLVLFGETSLHGSFPISLPQTPEVSAAHLRNYYRWCDRGQENSLAPAGAGLSAPACTAV